MSEQQTAVRIKRTDASPVDLMDTAGSCSQTRLVGHTMMKDGGPGQADVCCHGDVEAAAGWVCRRGFHSEKKQPMFVQCVFNPFRTFQ